jgi:hypothetical protein
LISVVPRLDHASVLPEKERGYTWEVVSARDICLPGGVIRSVSAAFLVAVAACAPARGASPAVAPALEVPPLQPAEASRGGGIRFGRIAPVAGARFRVAVEAASSEDADSEAEYVSTYVAETLAVEGPATTRVRVVFEKNAERHQGVEAPTVIDGKSYIVEAAPPYVEAADGGAVPDAERDRVLDVFPDLGTRTRIDQILPDGAMEIGEERPELAGAILHTIHPRAWSLDRGSAVLARVDGDAAVFAVRIAARSRAGLRIDVEGEVRIRLRDTRLVAIDLDGKYGHGPGDPGAGAGRFALKRTVRDVSDAREPRP